MYRKRNHIVLKNNFPCEVIFVDDLFPQCKLLNYCLFEVKWKISVVFPVFYVFKCKYNTYICIYVNLMFEIFFFEIAEIKYCCKLLINWKSLYYREKIGNHPKKWR